jgi:hypothetical protein
VAHVDDAVRDEREGAVERGQREQHAHGGAPGARVWSGAPARWRAGGHRMRHGEGEGSGGFSLGGAAAVVATRERAGEPRGGGGGFGRGADVAAPGDPLVTPAGRPSANGRIWFDLVRACGPGWFQSWCELGNL